MLHIFDGEKARHAEYRYENSPLDHYEIRCLVLAPGTDTTNEALACTLQTVNLTHKPKFEAISYTWGGSEKPDTIMCNGQPLRITSNLRAALLQVQHPDRERVLWADAICINQADKQEKSRQVRLMKEIYTQATRVLVCLGPQGDDHAIRAAALLADVNQLYFTTLNSITVKRWDSFPFPAQDEPLLSDTRWSSLWELFDQPWFKRGWVVEEAGLAAEVWVLWGGASIDWLHILRTVRWVASRASTLEDVYNIYVPYMHLDIFDHRHRQEVKLFFQRTRFYSQSFLGILEYGRELGFYDKRDHIYGFLGLPAAKNIRGDLTIDYNKPYLEVYRDFAVSYLEKTQHLDLLHYVEHDITTLRDDFPSWIPQWQIDPYRKIIKNDSHDTRSFISRSSSAPINRPVFSLLPGQVNLLKVRGLIIDSVQTLSSLLTEDSSVDDIAVTWRALRDSSEGITAYKAFSPLLAFLHCLGLGFGPSVSDDAQVANDGAYLCHLQGDSSDTSQGLSADDPSLAYFEEEAPEGNAEVVQGHVKYYTHNRRVVVTNRGYYGLVPGVAQEGDLCCIIFGTKTPFIIRKVENSMGGHYRLVGSAFIVSSKAIDDGYDYPSKLGCEDDIDASEDWLEWDLDEQDLWLS
ncbi:HET-domain-containing protein [Cryphonectria parasitica EP155]|uniref:HET-domain-containing protein n=1 Tax=Cryphonectria parasitica (strain ATCC 38755 / EP155) TaxID=660469 RepID=A0A9P5CNG3_CRYP1|nr:HET-domain-containing protein [Cryphonectria parasitica EP155]KAF3764297.1 HET-domain-containing protein [Cryphonectria parasitica EP155]